MKWITDHQEYFGDLCLTWPFQRDRHGYALVSIPGGVRVSASRVMCRLVHGDPPDESYQSAHSCGRGHCGCINPNHLRWATVAENAADKLLHGTHHRGERHGLAKLTSEDVRLIRRISDHGFKQRAIAGLFGVRREAISKILRGERWGWLR